jgi:hypothetical protein
MKHALLAAGAAILAATATPADAHGLAQGTTQGGVKLRETITPLFKRDNQGSYLASILHRSGQQP